jgi:hypothetical protein
MADNFTTFKCGLSADMKTLTIWNIKGLSRFVQELF